MVIKATTRSQVFPDNGHVGSPEHDRMVCELLDKNTVIKLPYLKKYIDRGFPLDRIIIRSEETVCSGTDRNFVVVGYWDVVVYCRSGWVDAIKDCLSPPCLYFEIKPTIPSFGSLLRQINLYRAYTTGIDQDIVIIYTPETKYDIQLRSQNIEVLHELPEVK